MKGELNYAWYQLPVHGEVDVELFEPGPVVTGEANDFAESIHRPTIFLSARLCPSFELRLVHTNTVARTLGLDLTRPVPRVIVGPFPNLKLGVP